MDWHSGPFAAFDIESTGTDTENDRIVTAAVTVVGAGREAESHSWLVDPGIEIPAEATAVHRITTEQAQREGVPAARAVREMIELLASLLADDIPVIAFNARFDLTMLDREARRYGATPLVDRVGGPDGLLVIDPYVIDKHYHPFRKGRRTLSVLCEDFRVPLEEAHAADADALAAARLVWKLARRYEDLGSFDLPTLHDAQVGWALEQADSLQQYFDGQGRNERVAREWPLVPYQGAEPEPLPEAA